MDAVRKLLFSDRQIQSLIQPLLGLPCCRTKVGEFFSLSLGFGSKVHAAPTLSGRRFNTEYYGEWEVGTYQKTWRVIRRSEILHGGCETVESESELNDRVADLGFGQLTSIIELSQWDVRMEFDTDHCVDFLGVDPCEEAFYVFCPNNISITFKSGVGWFVGPSNQPWNLG